MASPVLAKQPEAQEGLRSKLRSIVSGFDPETLSNAGITPQLNFSEARRYFSEILKIFQDLSERDLSSIPIRRLNDLQRSADETAQLFSQIISLSIQQYPSNAPQRRIDLLNQVQEQYGTLFDLFAPVLSYTTPRTDEIERIKSEASAALAEIQESRESNCRLRPN